MLSGGPARVFLFVLAVGSVACSGGHPTTTTVTTATTGPAPAAVAVRPTAGPVGTSVTLTASHFHPGEILRSEIGMPDGKIFKGPFHTVPADGIVSASIKTAAENLPGGYTIRAATDNGTSARGTFRLTPTTPPSHSSPTEAPELASTTTATTVSTTTTEGQ